MRQCCLHRCGRSGSTGALPRQGEMWFALANGVLYVHEPLLKNGLAETPYSSVAQTCCGRGGILLVENKRIRGQISPFLPLPIVPWILQIANLIGNLGRAWISYPANKLSLKAVFNPQIEL